MWVGYSFGGLGAGRFFIKNPSLTRSIWNIWLSLSRTLSGLFLYPENGAWVYVGASSARGEPYHNYSGRTEAIGAQVTPDDQIGLLTGIGNNHLRLEMPAIQESLLDVVEFSR